MTASKLFRRILPGLLLCILGAGITSNLKAALVANDNFVNSPVLSGSQGRVTGTNVGYTKQTGEPNHAGNTGGASAWYSWTAPASGWCTLDTLGSDFDTLLAVYSGTSVASLNPVASSDDINLSGTDLMQSQLVFMAASGSTYRIAVDGFNGATGNIVLNYIQPSPTGVVILNPSPLNTGTLAFWGDSVDGRSVITGTVNVTGTYAKGTALDMVAFPNDGYAFQAWDDGSTLNPRSLSVASGTARYTAKFIRLAYLTVLGNSTKGTVYGSGYFPQGSAQKIGATPANGYRFSQWNDGNTENPRIVTVPDAGATYTATFVREVTLTVAVSPSGAGTTTGGGTYAENDLATMSATANDGYIFLNWNDGLTDNPRTIRVIYPGATYTAIFGQTGKVSKDYFAHALVLPPVSSGTLRDTNVGFSKEAGEPNHAGNAGGASAWYFWTAPYSGPVTVDTFGSDFDTLLGVYTGSAIGSLSLVASNNDAVLSSGSTSRQSQVTFDAIGGTTYRVAVDGFDGASGVIKLNWVQKSVLTLIANPAEGGSLQGAGNYDANSTQKILAIASDGYIFSHWNDGVTQALRTVTVPAGGATYTAYFDPIAALNVVASPADGGTVTGSGTYLVGSSQLISATNATGFVFMGWDDGNTHATRNVLVPATGTTCVATFRTRTDDGNDNWANAFLLTGSSGSRTDNNIGFTSQTGEPDHAGNPAGVSAWFKWTAPFSGAVSFDTSGSSFDTVLAIYTGNSLDALTPIVSNDDASDATRQSMVAFNAVAGTTYYIAVDGVNAATGIITLNFHQLGVISVLASPEAAGVAMGSGTYWVGSIKSISASGNPGWWFTGWDDGNSDNPRSILVTGSNPAYTALFVKYTDDGNNNFTRAYDLKLSGSYEGVASHGTRTDANIGYTKEVGEPAHAGNPGGASAWYKWTAPATGPVTIDTIGSSFDTLLAVYTGSSVSSLTLVAENSDAEGMLQSRVTFNAQARTVYRIAVDGANGAQGVIHLNYGQPAILEVVAAPPEGGFVVGSGTYAVGSSQAIEATAASGWAFVAWNDGSRQNPRNVVVPAGGIVLTATFVQVATLDVQANPSYAGRVTGGGLWPVGSTQILRATASPGWVFTGWSDGETDNPRSVLVPLDGAAYVANFSPGAAVSVTADPVQGGSVAGSGTFVVGSATQISATPNPLWAFTSWNDGNTDNPRTINVPADGALFTARFEHQQSIISTEAIPANGGVVLGSGTYDVASQRELNAVPNTGWAFIGWSDNNTQNPRKVTVQNENSLYTARFSPDPTSFTKYWKGSYYGLIADPVTPGSLKVKMNADRSFTASVNLSGSASSLSGKLDTRGVYSGMIPRSPFLLTFQLAEEPGEMLCSLADEPYINIPFSASRSMLESSGTYSAAAVELASQLAAIKGSYTVVLRSGTDDLTGPQGSGYATLGVDKNGAVRLKGKLADGTVLNYSSAVTKNAEIPLYIPLYKQTNSAGFLLGMIAVADKRGSDLDGILSWVKPARTSDKVYPGGFALHPELLGSRFQPPTSGSSLAIAFQNSMGLLETADGMLSLTGTLSLAPGSTTKLAIPADAQGRSFSITLTNSTGLFSGNVIGLHRDSTGKPASTPVQGAILQKTSTGAGYFLENYMSGSLEITTRIPD